MNTFPRSPLQLPGVNAVVMTLIFDLLTLKVVSESRVMWATSLPILVFLGLSVLDFGPMNTTDVRQKHHLMPPPIRGRCIISLDSVSRCYYCAKFHVILTRGFHFIVLILLSTFKSALKVHLFI